MRNPECARLRKTAHRLSPAVLAGIVIVGATACQKPAASPNPQAVADAQSENFQMYASQVDHVVLATIVEERLERRPLPQKHLLHLKARVVRSYKGSWKESEVVSFSSGREGIPAEFANTDVVRDSGRLVVLFLKQRTNAEMFLDVGLCWHYQPQLKPFLEGLSRR